jgi:hypothetical protein
VTWELGSTALVALALAAGITWYERRRPPSRLVALVAALAALAIAGRVLFTPIPNVQGTTDVVVLSGYALGPLPGFVVGAVAALVSNFFLGQGPWTPWQMLGWGMAGVGGGALAATVGTRLGRWPLAVFCAAAGFAFGAWMDLFTVMAFAADRSAASYLTVAGVSFPFNAAHAIGNALLCLALGPAFVRMLVRFRDRLHVEWVPVEAALALAAVMLVGLPVTQARAADASLRYLERAQNADGGFGGGPGQPSSQLLTGWTMIGLEAAGRNPLDVRRGGRSPVDYTRAHLAELNDTGELERTILALAGARVDSTRFGGRNLVAELLRHRRADGSFEGQANWTAFGVMAMRAAGRATRSGAIRGSAAWLARQQNGDGGFSFAMRGGGSFVDETGAALQGLAAAGHRRGAVVTRALAYLRKAQNPDGGFGQGAGDRSNAQSTAWAVQGIVAVHRNPARFVQRGRSAIAFLASLRAGDGSYRYSRASAQTPVWVTAQAVAAVRRRALPLKPPPRVAKHVRAHRARVREPAIGRAKPQIERLRPSRTTRPVPAHQVVKTLPLATRSVSDAQHNDGHSGGSALWPAAGIAAAVALVAGSVAFAFRRRHV